MQSQANGKSTKKVKDAGNWARAKTKSAGRLNGSRSKNARLLEDLLEREDWSKAREVIQEELVFGPTDHWLWLHLGLTYYEQRAYEKSLKCAEYAVQREPDCPLALWHYAGSLYMNGNESAALAIWTTLLNMDLDEIAHGEHGEGMPWALQLVNDVHFRMGRCHQWQGNDDLARASFEKHLHNRRHGVGSIYDEKVAEKCLRAVAAE